MLLQMYCKYDSLSIVYDFEVEEFMELLPSLESHKEIQITSDNFELIKDSNFFVEIESRIVDINRWSYWEQNVLFCPTTNNYWIYETEHGNTECQEVDIDFDHMVLYPAKEVMKPMWEKSC